MKVDRASDRCKSEESTSMISPTIVERRPKKLDCLDSMRLVLNKSAFINEKSILNTDPEAGSPLLMD